MSSQCTPCAASNTNHHRVRASNKDGAYGYYPGRAKQRHHSSAGAGSGAGAGAAASGVPSPAAVCEGRSAEHDNPFAAAEAGQHSASEDEDDVPTSGKGTRSTKSSGGKSTEDSSGDESDDDAGEAALCSLPWTSIADTVTYRCMGARSCEQDAWFAQAIRALAGQQQAQGPPSQAPRTPPR